MVAMVAQQCKCTLCHRTAHQKMVKIVTFMNILLQKTSITEKNKHLHVLSVQSILKQNEKQKPCAPLLAVFTFLNVMENIGRKT